MYQIIKVRLFFITLSTFSISSLDFSINYVWSHLIFVEIDLSKGNNHCVIDLMHKNILKNQTCFVYHYQKNIVVFIAKIFTSFSYTHNIVDS